MKARGIEWLARARREPLVWFLLAGLLLFALHALVAPDEDDPNSQLIRIDRERLLEFVQLRARSFNENAAARSVEQMAPEDVAAMVGELAREEALYREALRLGLDRNDYVLRRRLVQSLEYIADSGSEAADPPDEAALRKYYEAHRARYTAAPAISFAHVFFSAQAHGGDGALKLARSAQAKLNAGRAGGEGLPGDRFLYLQNYAERSPELVESHFGQDFAKALFQLKAQPGRWQGPLRSEHGYHLVEIVDLAQGRPLSFEQARVLVATDAVSDAGKQRRAKFVEQVLSRYKVDLDSDVRKLMATKQ